jgi:eukaryotic-like serine/threonine-protein kinase
MRTARHGARVASRSVTLYHHEIATIPSGTHLGPYRIDSLVGHGGMGEVYRGLDTRLSRPVAIKVLPERLSALPHVRDRFAREARSISHLSHPNICALHDVGSHEGIDYLVMELLEGESLAERLVRGSLPLPEVLRYGAQIAEALAFAHRAGVVHRDVKPGNIVITKGGAKLLDFGLAKTAAATFTQDAPTEQYEQPLTAEGSVLGTLQYMAPEQLAGEEADARTDIFALGLVLYEMTTGKRAFDGKSRTSLVSAIVAGEPSAISQIQPLTPKPIEQVIATCLAKDPDRRWQSAYDVALQLRAVAEGKGYPETGGTSRPRFPRWVLAAFTILALATAILGALAFRRTSVPPQTTLAGSIAPPQGATIQMGGPSPGALTVSPDSRYVTFAATSADDAGSLWIRDMRTGESRMLPGTRFGEYPFWSPDSRQLGFFADGKLKTIPAEGGPTVEICAVKESRGATWGPGGIIVFANHWRGPLYKVSTSGGTPEAVTQLDVPRNETTHRWPQFLPDGKHFLFFAGSHTSQGSSGNNAIYIGSIDGGTPRLLLRTRSNAAFAAGRLLYMRGDDLVAQRFDPDSHALDGEAVRVAEQVSYDPGFFHGAFAASDRLLLYQHGSPAQSRLVWIKRDGSPDGEASEPETYFGVALAPPSVGNVAAVSIGDPADVWLIDFDRGVRTRITSDPWEENNAIWSPDGKSLLYWNNRNVQNDAYVRAIAASSETRLAADPSLHERPVDWSSTGIVVAKAKTEGVVSYDLWLYPVGTSGAPRTLIASPFDEWDGRISPDGAMITWVSDESGRDEIYLAPLTRPLERLQVSNAGGVAPRWRADSKEIFYVAADASIVSVPVLASNPVRAGSATPLFKTSIVWALEPFYDAAPDGQRFLVNRLDVKPIEPMTFVAEWATSVGR